VNFYDDVFNGAAAIGDHKLKVGGGSAIVVFGVLHGAGLSSDSQGTLHAEGGTNFGYSPASLEMGGNLVFGENSTNTIELGGAAVGSFDQLNVAGQVVLNGDLDVVFYDGYVPADGTVFTIVTGSEVVGQFDNVSFTRGVWDVDYSATSVTLTAIAVPEPATLGAIALGAAGLIRRRRRVA